MNLDEAGLGEERMHLAQGCVETLHMTHLNHKAPLFGQSEQLVRLLNGARERFFDQDGDSRAEECFGDREMVLRGDCDRDGFHLSEQLARVRDRQAAVILCHGLGPLRQKITYRNQL